ncbi:MAG: Rv1355c family protein [Algoriphagus sp.]|uniref:Rv1355c family protein n=1 Tax=Algoriphagus sp. TaxID=1872435 RepID=UPI002731E765|nr:Rv1355c family protein [Algoriphagus sp.]MDP2039765.1 Rv1355c family protein [Algoriphagus sp.]MDP3471553.1 Rv1355c family protein [Algoriphagus sp.]
MKQTVFIACSFWGKVRNNLVNKLTTKKFTYDLINYIYRGSSPRVNMLTYSKSDLGDQVYPVLYNPSDPSDLEGIQNLKANSFIYVVDEIDSQVSDLIKSQSPEYQFSKEELQERVKDFFRDKDKERFGNWVYYPWKYTLVHLLPEKDFIRVRTVRNNFKITPSEQQELGTKKIGIIGLSVGQSIALAMALERSCGEMRLADFDILELSNLNRLKAGVTSLGIEKVVIAAREISEIDPYLKVTLFREGINEDNIGDFLTANGKLDLLVDECDSLDIKVLIRERAKLEHIPVMMDTSDRGMLDIERFDVEPKRKIFHGMLEGITKDELANLSNKERVAIVLKITGLETLSLRMKASLLEIGSSITSWPQLASGVFLGGASVAHVGRRLLLGENVPSGRFYVDFDEIIKIDQVEEIEVLPNNLSVSTSSKKFLKMLPDNILQSGYILSVEELKLILSFANMAPSGGNIQPWIWVFDSKGILHLFHDKERSHSMLDFKGSGSLIAFGAALENLRLIAAKEGIEIEFIDQIKEFEQDLICSIRFIAKFNNPISVPYLELADGISLRCTNRKNNSRQLLPLELLEELASFAENEGLSIKFTEDKNDIESLSEIVGGMDRMRFFHEEGLMDFIKEVRWTENDAIQTKDGIDIATLELSGTEKAAMGLLKDPRTVKFFRKFLMGYGLTKISKDTMCSSSCIMVLQGEDFSSKSYLEGGRVLQRIWIKANMLGISFQPVTAMLFIFHKVSQEANHGFSKEEEKEIIKLKTKFDSIFPKKAEKQDLFMFRLNVAGEPSVRAYRRDVEDTLILV